MKNLLKLCKEENLTLTEAIAKLGEYYNSDPRYWSDKKLDMIAGFYSSKQDTKQKAVFDLPFEPEKASAIELIFENCESIVVPIANIKSLSLCNEKVLKTWENDDGQKVFERCHEMHIFGEVDISFFKDETYTSYFSLEPDGDTDCLTSFLGRQNIAQLRCIYEPKHFSYSIYPKWEGEYKNKFQSFTQDNEIHLAIRQSLLVE